MLPEPWGYAGVAAGGLVEVGEAVFWWRWTHRRRPAVGPEALVGALGVVVEPCRPDGSVRVHGELWAARCEPGVDAGMPVRVLALEAAIRMPASVTRASARPKFTFMKRHWSQASRMSSTSTTTPAVTSAAS